MSFIFDNKKNKEKCQKFTPPEMIETMLDLAGYTSNLMGQRVLENSFGSGNILKAIVKRYIDSCLTENVALEIISRNLEIDICGIELDKELFQDCIKELNKIVQDFNLPPVKWNLYNTDALTWQSETKFDLVIGNPPYITHKEIDPDSRIFIKENFSTCAAGKFDYCYAFIELGLKMLKDTGKLVQLVPSNIYKNVFAEEVRKCLQPHISVILDYPSQQIFKSVLTSTSIFLYDKNFHGECIQYKNMTEDYTLQIPRTSLIGKWMFANIPKREKTVRFGDEFHASVVIATLLNQAFLVNEEQIAENKIEKEMIRPAASPRSFQYNRKEHIIFPYRYVNNKLTRISPQIFEKDFPMTAQYLKGYIEQLNARKKDKASSWFEYGRSQALAHLNQPKLLISTVITNNIDLYYLETETIPYSGIYIVPKDNNHTLKEAEKIRRSAEFLKYVKRVGINVNGKSIRITCKDINNFEFVRG